METTTIQIPYNNKILTLSNISIFKATDESITNNSISLWKPTTTSVFHPINIANPLLAAQLQRLPPDLSFSCLFCKFIFYDPNLLLGHMENAHPELIERKEDAHTDSLDKMKQYNESVEVSKTETINFRDDIDFDESMENFDEFFSLMEPICELSEMDIYDEDGVYSYENKGQFELTSKSSSDEETFNDVSIKIPQGPGRGRRREMDDEEMDMINSTGFCFFKCTVCDKQFKFAGDLAKHIRSHTLNNPFQCSICDKKFTHIGSLNTHLRIHKGEKPYQCKQCDKSFTQSSSLTVHIKSHSIKKPYQCELCDKGFVNSSSLMLHMKSHIEGDPYPCEKCNKTFKHNHLLAEHMKLHSEEYLYQCSICHKQFSTSALLVQHMKFHTGEKPFQCSLCEKSFTQPGSLNTHMRIHSGEKPYVCKFCSKSFTQASSLSVHMKIHIVNQLFNCPMCHKTYSQSSYLMKHLQFHQKQ